MVKPWHNENNSFLVIRPQGIPMSFRFQRQVLRILPILGLITLIGMIVSVSIGDYPISMINALKTVGGIGTITPNEQLIVNTLRFPRTLVAFLVGVGLGCAGTITQGITRNPLASPDIIGINAGASLATVTLIVLLPDISATMLPLAAFGGALIVSLLIYWAAWRSGGSSGRLILIGVGFSLIAGALTNIMLTFGRIGQVSQALVWLAGSVYGRSWEQASAILPWIVFLAYCLSF